MYMLDNRCATVAVRYVWYYYDTDDMTWQDAPVEHVTHESCICSRQSHPAPVPAIRLTLSRHRLKGYLTQRVPSLVFASSSGKHD